MISKKRQSIRKCPLCGGIVWKRFIQDGKTEITGRYKYRLFRGQCGECARYFTPEEFEGLEDYGKY